MKGSRYSTGNHYRDRVTCPTCGVEMTVNGYRAHKGPCATAPTAEVLAQRLRDDPNASVSSLADEYGVSHIIIKRKLINGSDWTQESIKKRGMAARYNANKRKPKGRKRVCKTSRPDAHRCLSCGIIVDESRTFCNDCYTLMLLFVKKNEVPEPWREYTIQYLKNLNAQLEYSINADGSIQVSK